MSHREGRDQSASLHVDNRHQGVGATREKALRICVTDHGRGIAPEFRGRIFQKFAQADSSDARQKGGTGLGLSIAKSIIERLGGQIDFESQVNVGSTFYFDLPEWRPSRASGFVDSE